MATGAFYIPFNPSLVTVAGSWLEGVTEVCGLSAADVVVALDASHSVLVTFACGGTGVRTVSLTAQTTGIQIVNDAPPTTLPDGTYDLGDLPPEFQVLYAQVVIDSGASAVDCTGEMSSGLIPVTPLAESGNTFVYDPIPTIAQLTAETILWSINLLGAGGLGSFGPPIPVQMMIAGTFDLSGSGTTFVRGLVQQCDVGDKDAFTTGDTLAPYRATVRSRPFLLSGLMNHHGGMAGSLVAEAVDDGAVTVRLLGDFGGAGRTVSRDVSLGPETGEDVVITPIDDLSVSALRTSQIEFTDAATPVDWALHQFGLKARKEETP